MRRQLARQPIAMHAPIVLQAAMKKPLISVRQEDEEVIKRRIIDKEMQEIDELLNRAEKSLERASPDRSETMSVPNSYSLKSLARMNGFNPPRSKSTFRPLFLNNPGIKV